MMPTLKISIVTAVFNRKLTVADTIESLQSQTYPEVEHIIQDGGSTDGTLEILRRYGHPSMAIQSAPDRGIYDAINRGILRSTGDVIGLLHSDDFFFDATILSRVAEAFQDPEIDGIYGDLNYVSSDNTNRVIRRWRSGPYSHDRLRFGWMPPHPTLYLRRAVLAEWGLYDTSYRISADYDAILRYLGKGKIKLKYLPLVMVNMRAGGESNRSVSTIVRKSCEDYRAIRTNRVGGLPTLAMKNLSKLRQFL